MKKAQNKISNIISTWGVDVVKNEIEKQFGFRSQVQINNFRIEHENTRIAKVGKIITKSQKELDEFKINYLNPYKEAFMTGELKLYLFYHTFEELIPVALAGRGDFVVAKINNSDDKKDVHVVISLIPSIHGTELVIAAPDKYLNELQHYIAKFKSYGENLGIILMIESWMLHGSDHWFIKPSLWNDLSVERKNSILEAIKSTDYNIGNKPIVSILDTIKSNYE